MSQVVGWSGLATSLALVAIAAAISLWQRLGLEWQILWAAARALVQLLLVGGSVVVEAGEMRTVDSDSLAKHARDSARELARRAGVSSAG